MNMWTSARTAADCFRKMTEDEERSSAQKNAGHHGTIGTLILQTGRIRIVHAPVRNAGKNSSQRENTDG